MSKVEKSFWLITNVVMLALFGAPVALFARDVVADEFNAIARFIARPQASEAMEHAYSQESMPMPGERDPVDVLLRRSRSLLEEFNTDGSLDILDHLLAELEERNGLVPRTDTNGRLELFRQVENVSRKVAFSNPLLKFKDLVFLKRHHSTLSHMCDQYFGIYQREGGGIYILEDAFSDAPLLRDVLANSTLENGRFMGQKLEGGSFLSPALSYDGKTIYFSHTMIKSGDFEDQDAAYHIYKVNTDGSGLRQLTDGPVDDITPCPLPNGRIVFISRRRGGYGRCHGRKVPVYTLYSMNADGTDITVMSLHESNEWHPSVDNNGMIVYSRWDYVDRGDDQAHHPWICYPDGRDPRAIHGNYRRARYDIPYMELHVRAIPESHKYVATAAPHHGEAFGSLVLLDPRKKDDDFMNQLKTLTPEARFPESDTRNNADWKFVTAWPLSERFYLCGYDPNGSGNNCNHALAPFYELNIRELSGA